MGVYMKHEEYSGEQFDEGFGARFILALLLLPVIIPPLELEAEDVYCTIRQTLQYIQDPAPAR